MTDIVEEARALLAQATPGPWNDGITEIDAGLYGCTSVVEATCNPTKWGGCGGCELRISKPDRALIAASPRLLAALADECERLRDELADARRVRSEAVSSFIAREEEIDRLNKRITHEEAKNARLREAIVEAMYWERCAAHEDTVEGRYSPYTLAEYAREDSVIERLDAAKGVL